MENAEPLFRHNENSALCFHRSDSPGFSAKYTTYSFMDDWTTRIIQSNVIQVNVITLNRLLCNLCLFFYLTCGHCLQVTEAKSSVAMEPLGLRRGLRSLLDQGLPISIVTTDRSSSIRKIMREEFPKIIRWTPGT